jgi:hypothetical protein
VLLMWPALASAAAMSRSERRSPVFGLARRNRRSSIVLADLGQGRNPRNYRQEASIGVQNISLSTHGLEIDGIRGVGLDLATQSVDLHIDCTLAAG